MPLQCRLQAFGEQIIHQVKQLSPQLVNFDNRLRVMVNDRQKFNDFVKPDMAALLEDLRRRGDRQQLYWAVLEF